MFGSNPCCAGFHAVCLYKWVFCLQRFDGRLMKEDWHQQDSCVWRSAGYIFSECLTHSRTSEYITNSKYHVDKIISKKMQKKKKYWNVSQKRREVWDDVWYNFRILFGLWYPYFLPSSAKVKNERSSTSTLDLTLERTFQSHILCN